MRTQLSRHVFCLISSTAIAFDHPTKEITL